MTDEEIDAMEAGWQMDRVISIAVFGLEPQECMVGGHPPGCPGNIPITPYSTDIAAAWQVVEKMRAFSISRHLDGSWHCWHWNKTHLNANADTAPLAICRAALKCCKAVGKEA